MAHIINAAIQVEVNLAYDDAVEVVESVVRRAFGGYKLIRVDLHSDPDVLFPRPGRDVDGDDEVCECGDTGWIASQPNDSEVSIERCDLCEKYEGDLDAAIAYAAANRGQVHVIGDAVTQMIHGHTDPWVTRTAICLTCGATIRATADGWIHLPPWGEHDEPIIVDTTSVVWHSPEQARRAGDLDILVGVCRHCGVELGYEQLADDGTWQWISAVDGGSTCNNPDLTVRQRHEPLKEAS